MSHANDGNEGEGIGRAEGPPPNFADADVPMTAASPARHQSPARHPARQPVSSHKRRASDRRAAKSLPDVEAQGRADAVVVPIIGTLLGLMAIGAVGLILASRRKSQSLALLAALNAAPAKWLHDAVIAEHRLASDLNERISRARRQYGI